MLKLIFIFSFVLIAVQGIAQTETRLSGTITHPTGDSVFIFKIENIEGKRERSKLKAAKINEGEFDMVFNLSTDEQLTFTDDNENCTILMSPGDDIFMTLNTQYFDETLLFTGKGAEKNNALITLYLIQESITSRVFDNLDAPDTLSLFSALDENLENYTALIKDYMISLEGFESYGTYLLESTEMTKTQIKKYASSEIEFKKKMALLEGKKALDFEGIDLNGKKVKLSDYQGKMIVVDFWATWCGPCRAEFLAYKKLEEEYGEEINFVSVAAFCVEEDWNAMATNEGFKNNIFLSKEAESQIKEYAVNSIPRYLVIDKNFMLVDAAAPRPSSGELPAYWLK